MQHGEGTVSTNLLFPLLPYVVLKGAIESRDQFRGNIYELSSIRKEITVIMDSIKLLVNHFREPVE